MKYNYLEAMQADIIEYLENDLELKNFTDDCGNVDREALSEFLNDELWTCDGVTGNASGSYTFNRLQAREYVIDNGELLEEAIREFCVDAETVAEKFLSEDWEYFDVTIRCYLLGQAIEKALDEFLPSVSISQF